MTERIGRLRHRDASPKGGGPSYWKDKRASFWEYWDIIEVNSGQRYNKDHKKGAVHKGQMFIRLPVDGMGLDEEDPIL